MIALSLAAVGVVIFIVLSGQSAPLRQEIDHFLEQVAATQGGRVTNWQQARERAASPFPFFSSSKRRTGARMVNSTNNCQF